MAYDASDPVQVKKAEDQDKDRTRDIASVMSTPRGRRWVHELIFETCHIQKLSMTGDNVYFSAFNEGARSVGLKLLEEVKQHPVQYFKMMEENFDGPD